MTIDVLARGVLFLLVVDAALLVGFAFGRYPKGEWTKMETGRLTAELWRDVVAWLRGRA